MAAAERARPSAPTELSGAPRSPPRVFAGAVMELMNVEDKEIQREEFMNVEDKEVQREELMNVEDKEMQREEFGKESGWCEVRRGAKKRCNNEAGLVGNKHHGRTFIEEAARHKWKNERNVRQIIRASRMPSLPKEDYRVIVRPRGGLNLSDYKLDRIYCCLRNAAGVGRETAEEDSICINSTQNIVVLSTPSEDRARKYGAINKLRFGEQEFEASAYRAAPDNTSKGLIRGISKEESPEDIVTSLVTPRNPGVLHAKRMGNTDNVIVLFEGFYVPSYVRYGAMLIRCSLYKKQIDICYECGRTGHRADVCPNPEDKICRGCGCKNPQHDHNCQAECQLCGRDHLTGDKNCDARYKIPYLVRRRRWERRRREEQYAEEYYNHNNKEARGSNNNNNNHTTISSKHPSTDKEETSRKNYERDPGRDRSGSFPRQSGEAGRGRSRSRSSTRSRTRSRSRPRSGSSTSRGGDGSKAQVSWASVVSGTATHSPKAKGSALEQEMKEIRKMLEHITRENATLKEEIKQLRAENTKLQQQKKNSNTPSASRTPTPSRAPTPVPAQANGEAPPHKRKAQETVEEKSDFTISEVMGTFKEMFDGIQQQITNMYVDIKQRFDGLENRVAALESIPKDTRPTGAGPVKSKPYSRPTAAENSKATGEDQINQNGAA